jgi:signal transduction histidine kinase
MRATHSLRSKLLLMIVAGVLVPLAVLGLWLARSAQHSGETLLRGRLDDALVQVVDALSARWVAARSALLDVAESTPVQRLLAADTGATRDAGARRGARSLTDARGLGDVAALRLVVRDRAGRVRGTLTADGDSLTVRAPGTADNAASSGPTAGITAALPVYARVTGEPLGVLEVRLLASTLVPVGAGGTGGIGAVLGVVDRATGASLVPLPFDPALLARDEFEWAGDRWLVRRLVLDEPAVVLAAAAPVGAYTAPFERAARRGALALLGVAAAALALAALATRRLTRSLEQLAEASDAVSRGDLGRRVRVLGDDEVGRVGRAFNAMVESLRRTLDELARRERLAAVGEFAASLAHEVRNPLTSIRITLQRVEEQVPPESPLRVPLGRALHEVSRLDRTVSGALRVARSGRAGEDLVDLRAPLERAMQVAEAAFEQAGGTLEPLREGAAPIPVRGDAAALEQLFLNLLLNAAQALPSGARTDVTAVVSGDGAEVVVRDTGRGIPAAALGRVFEPFFSTTPEGTGLGLAVARQVAIAHGGDITVESEEGVGTAVRVRIPLAHAADGVATASAGAERNELRDAT